MKQGRLAAITVAGRQLARGLVEAPDESSPPEVPAAPVLTGGPGDAQVGLSWTAPDDGGSPITTYELQRDAVEIYDALSPRSFIDTGRTNNVQYAYRVRAVNAVGPGAWSTVVNVTPVAATPPSSVPAAPQLNGTPGDTFADLAWTVPSDGGSPILRYELQRDAVKIQEDLSTGRHDTGLTNGVIYTYRVRAENAVGNGPFSNFVNVQPFAIEPPDTVPGAPAITGSPGDTVNNLNWSAPSDGGDPITTYELERTGGANAIGVGTVATGSANNQASCTVACTVAGSDRVLIVAISHRSSIALRTISSVTFNGDALAPVPNGAAQRAASNMGAELWWMPAPDVATGNVVVTMSGAADIDVCAIPLTNVHQASPFGQGGTDNDNTANPDLVIASAAGELVVDCLAAVTSGAITVGAGQTQRANQVTSTSGQIVRQGVSTEAGGASVTMSWTRDADHFAYVAVALKPSASSGAIIYDAVSPRSFVDTGRTNGVAYTYRVRAVNGVGDGPWSADITLTPAAASASVPGAPTLTTVPGNNSASSTWTAPSTGGSAIIRYELFRGFTLIYSALSPRSFVDTGRPNGVQETYWVRAVNAIGAGPPSNLQPVTPNPVTGADLPADTVAAKAAWHFAGWFSYEARYPTAATVDTWRTKYGFDISYPRFNVGSGFIPGYGTSAKLVAADATQAPYASDSRYDAQRDYQAGSPFRAKADGKPWQCGFFVKIHKPRDNEYKLTSSGPVTPHQNGDLGPFGPAWGDDAGWAAVCAAWKEFVAGAVYLGADRFNFDPEFGTWDYRPVIGTTVDTMAKLRAKIEQRGFEFIKAALEVNPDLKFSHYGTAWHGSWHMEVITKNSGGSGDGEYFHDPAEIDHDFVQSAIKDAQGNSIGPVGPQPANQAYLGIDQNFQAWQHEHFYRGAWRAMATYGSELCTWTYQDAFWYHANTQYNNLPTNSPGTPTTLQYAMRWGLWGFYSHLSRDSLLSRATKRKIMRAMRWAPVSWIGTDSGNGYYNTQLREPDYTNLLKAGRIWGMDYHVEYFNGQEIGTPDGFMGNNVENGAGGSQASAGRPISISFGFHPFSGQKKPGLTPKTATLGNNSTGNSPATQPGGAEWDGVAMTYLSADVAVTPADWTARYVPPASRAVGMLAACDPTPIPGITPPVISNLAADENGGVTTVTCRVRHQHAVRVVTVHRGSTFNKANPVASLLEVMEMTFEPNNGTNLPPAGLADPYQDCVITLSGANLVANGGEVVVGAYSTKDDIAWKKVTVT